MKTEYAHALVKKLAILPLLLVAMLLAPNYAQAQEFASDDVPSSWRYGDGKSEDAEQSASLENYATLQANIIGRGIDVSEWQGDIDWQTVKNSGQVDFAIIRCGFAGTNHDRADYKWERNASECERLGIPYGVYVYSYARDWGAQASLAQKTISWIGRHSPSYPVFIDMEDSTIIGCGRDTLTSFVKSFCDEVENAGFIGGVYSNTNWFNNVLYGDQLDNYVKWVAQWNSVCTYGGKYEMWQYTSKGSVPGISGNVDLNYLCNEFRVNESRYKGVYDYDYYVENNKDVLRAYGGDRRRTLLHFINYGMNEGRRASAMFDLELYKELHDDCTRAYGNNNKEYYMHFLDYGMNEGRKASIIFNQAYYRQRYEDLNATYGGNIRAYYEHFIDYGMNEGRNGSVMFDVELYKDLQEDCVRAYGGNNKAYYSHFLNYGINEGRQASIVFNQPYYKQKYADLPKAYGNNIKEYYKHFLEYGLNEGRCASDMFDVEIYKANYADLSNAYGTGYASYYEHFVCYGMKEARRACSTFDVSAYYNLYQDLRLAYRGDMRKYYYHYLQYGKNEKRQALNCTSLKDPVKCLNSVDYSLVYDQNYYFNKYADLQKAYTLKTHGNLIDDVGLLEHFCDYGMSEGRQAIESFNVEVYRAGYSDLRVAYGNNLKKYYEHYIQYGHKEGRVASE